MIRRKETRIAVIGRLIALAMITSAFLGGCKSWHTGHQPPSANSVLVPTSRQPTAQPTAAGTVVRQRNVEVRVPPLAAPHNQVVELQLFPDLLVQAEGVRTEAAGDGFVWVGQVRGEPTSLVILSVQGSVLAGNVNTARGEIYEIRPSGNGVHVVRQLDPQTFVEDDVNSGLTTAELAPPSPNADPCGGTDTGESIDVMIAYTATARANNGGTDGIRALVYAAVAATNQSYLNSAVNQRMRLVHLREEAYTESGNSCTDLVRLRNSGDGQLDAMLTARDTHGADLVILMVDGALVSSSSSTGAGGGCGGSSFGVFGEVYAILNPNTTAFEPNALAVVQVSAATTNLTFAHEAGHLMGARHERLGDPTHNAPFVNNHGFFNSAAGCLQRSVMTRIAPCPTCTRVPFWSNPGTLRCGSAFGVAAPPTSSADNHDALNMSAATVANFRCSSPGRSDVWMRDTWDDNGTEANPDTGPMWVSPYIWIRTTQDTTLTHEHEHQTPALGSPVWIYTKLHHGSGPPASGTLEVWYADSSTGLGWPATWTLAGSAPVSAFASSSTRIVEIPWTTPTTAPGTGGHYCLVARWVSAGDPIVGEGSSIFANVRNSNNLVWRNLEQLPMSGDGTTDAVFVVRNVERGATVAPVVALRFAPVKAEANGSFFHYGRGTVTLDRKLLAAWRQGGSQGRGFRADADGRLVITDPEGAVLENIYLDGEATATLHLQRTATTPDRTFHVEAMQLSAGAKPQVIGGVTYELTPSPERE